MFGLVHGTVGIEVTRAAPPGGARCAPISLSAWRKNRGSNQRP